MTETRDVVYFTYINEDLDSSALECIWYDVFSKRLFVEFSNGSVAGYANVPVNVVEALESASSVGAYYSKYIKPIYHGVNSNVDLKAFNADTYANASAGFVPTKARQNTEVSYSEIVDEKGQGEYKISFTVEAVTTFKAPSGSIVDALNAFVGAFQKSNESGATIRIRSIEEIV